MFLYVGVTEFQIRRDFDRRADPKKSVNSDLKRIHYRAHQPTARHYRWPSLGKTLG